MKQTPFFRMLAITFCMWLFFLLVIILTSCSSYRGIERYTYVKPGWQQTHPQCVAYYSTKPVKRGYYFRIQQHHREIKR